MALRDLLDVSKALGDENRLRILAALKDRELCVCQVVELLQLANSTTSKHMSILRQARLVEGRKDGRWMHYRWAEEEATAEAKLALSMFEASLAGDKSIRDDRKRLKQILSISPEELCKRQCAPATAGSAASDCC
jgi:DNA-binding transcriptional ArsR family regulator